MWKWHLGLLGPHFLCALEDLPLGYVLLCPLDHQRILARGLRGSTTANYSQNTKLHPLGAAHTWICSALEQLDNVLLTVASGQDWRKARGLGVFMGNLSHLPLLPREQHSSEVPCPDPGVPSLVQTGWGMWWCLNPGVSSSHGQDTTHHFDLGDGWHVSKAILHFLVGFAILKGKRELWEPWAAFNPHSWSLTGSGDHEF